MALNQILIAELQHEAASTRKMLERVPTEFMGWKPHEKSMTLGKLAVHVAELNGWATMICTTDELNFATFDYKPFVANTTEELLNFFDQTTAKSIETLQNASDETLMKMWTLRKGDHVIMEQPRAVVLRNMVFNHMYHHRGQISVYLRLLNIPVPGVYGPSADEMEMMAATN
jgi:uncharacterized damage-inducible protein DinB